MKKYDENGTLIYQSGKGWKVWNDADGNLIHLKWSDGTERWCDYDADGNLIHEKWRDGTEHWFDDNGNVVRKI